MGRIHCVPGVDRRRRRSAPMPHLQKSPLRPLTDAERTVLVKGARTSPQRADRVARAKALLAVAEGATFTDAARAAGRRAGDAVAKLVARFHAGGLAAP